MSKVSLAGNASGTGIFTIASPNSNTDRTLTLPDNTGTLLTSGSAIAASQMPAGSVIQVVSSSTNINVSSSSLTWVLVNAALVISITPQFSTSKILVMFMGGNIDNLASASQPQLTIYRNASTNLSPSGTSFNFNDFYSDSGRLIAPMNVVHLDNPATTSSTSYGLYWQNQSTGKSQAINTTNSQVTMVLMEIKQ